jgi:hypothetical protein
MTICIPVDWKFPKKGKDSFPCPIRHRAPRHLCKRRRVGAVDIGAGHALAQRVDGGGEGGGFVVVGEEAEEGCV